MANVKNNESVTAVMNVKFENNEVKCGKCGETIGRIVKDEREKQNLESMGYVGIPIPASFVGASSKASTTPTTNADAIVKAALAAGVKADDPVLMKILGGIENYGHLAAPALRRRFIATQMLSAIKFNSLFFGTGINGYIRSQGYEKTWEVIANEVHYLANCEKHHDYEALAERSKWWTIDRIGNIAYDFTLVLQNHFNELKTRKCKGIPYRKFHGVDIFVSDFYDKMFLPLYHRSADMHNCKTYTELEEVLSGRKYNTSSWRELTVNKSKIMCNLPHDTEISKTYYEVYKGAGAFYTALNMICYQKNYDYRMYEGGKMLSKMDSEKLIRSYNDKFSKKGEGYKMLGVLKEFLDDNHIDINAQKEAWKNESLNRN